MDPAKMCGFLASGCLLLLTLLGDPINACMCNRLHPQTVYCNADFVIKAKFMSRSEKSRWWHSYAIQISEVFKGSQQMIGNSFLITPSVESLCGYELHAPFGKEDYIITGEQTNDGPTITLCSFIQPWAQLSPEQIHGIRTKYIKGCSCEICFPRQCLTTNSRCIWKWNLYGTVDDNKACMPKGRHSCSWQSLNS